MPLDSWMPTYDARSAHQLEVGAEPDVVFRALKAADFGRHPVVRVLMALRAVPALLLAPRRALARWRQVSAAAPAPGLGKLLAGGFVLLAEEPDRELTFGLTGRFWKPAGDLVPTDPARFREPIPAGLARAAWELRVEPLAAGCSRLTTETRVLCADAAARRAFLRYWRFIRLGSGVIRLALLRQVQRAAERTAGKETN